MNRALTIKGRRSQKRINATVILTVCAIVSSALITGSCTKSVPATPPIVPVFAAQPEIELDPHLNSPLAALLTYKTNVITRADIKVSTDSFSHTIHAAEFNTAHAIPVFGLRPDKEFKINLEVFTRTSSKPVLSKTLTITTDPLPDGFPGLQVSKRNGNKMEPGFTLFDIIPEGGNAEFGALIAIVDNFGEVVWYQVGSRYTDLRQLGNGDIIFIEGNKAVQMDLLGERKFEWHAVHNPPKTRSKTYVNTHIFHHELFPLRRGNFLSLSVEYRSYDDYPTDPLKQDAPRKTTNVVGDVVVEFRPDGSIRKQWSLLDLLDPRRVGRDSLGGYWDPFFNKETRDWTHANAVIHNPSDNTIIVTSRHQDVTFKFNRKNGELIWLLGPDYGWDKEKFGKYLLKPVNDRKYFFPYHSHAPEIMPNGNILLYDNGNYRAGPDEEQLPFDQNFSRAVEYRIDEKKHEVELVWEYGEFIENRIYSGALGDADYLPGKNNVLITHGNISDKDGKLSSAIIEVTHTTPAEEVFRLDVFDTTSNPKNGWRIYRSERIADLYGPETGISISEYQPTTAK